MNESVDQLLRTTRPDEPLGSPAVTAARHQVLDSVTRPTARRRPARSRRVVRWALAPVAAAAAVITVGVSGVGLGDRPASPAGTAGPAASPPTAAYVLHSAAIALASSDAVVPRGDQFLYQHTSYGDGTDSTCWYSVDGSQESRCTNQPGPFQVPAVYDADAPTSPGDWGAYLSQKWHDGAIKDSVVELQTQYLQPDSKASLYDYLAGLPGLKVVHGLHVSGADATGVDLGGDGQNVLLFSTGAQPTYLGIQQGSGPAYLTTTAIVDREGQQP